MHLNMQTNDTGSDGCDDGFIKYGEHCYHFSHDTEAWIYAKVGSHWNVSS